MTYTPNHESKKGHYNTIETKSNIDSLNELVLKAESHTNKEYYDVSVDNWREAKSMISQVSKDLRHIGQLELARDIDALKKTINSELRSSPANRRDRP